MADNQKTWEALTCKFEKGFFLHNSIPISPNEILIFGGKNEDGW